MFIHQWDIQYIQQRYIWKLIRILPRRNVFVYRNPRNLKVNSKNSCAFSQQAWFATNVTEIARCLLKSSYLICIVYTILRSRGKKTDDFTYYWLFLLQAMQITRISKAYNAFIVRNIYVHNVYNCCYDGKQFIKIQHHNNFTLVCNYHI